MEYFKERERLIFKVKMKKGVIIEENRRKILDIVENKVLNKKVDMEISIEERK